uniref:UBA domain-containing protein n=1 Tax=Noctiluca scintillans TaxID=2966 RepID=A0A7S1A190_NOCSC|mmetsp:Transcript_27675/g.72995  ORF Transcript_27675/g.72995 Transcript_27675/m.72995 type:complete len:548 (+) Transcript_27675:81-1724(+)
MDGAGAAVDDHIGNIRLEWKVQKEKWFCGEPLDPVFEGMVRDFCTFDDTMRDVYRKVKVFMTGIDQLADGLVALSDSVTDGMAHAEDPSIASDSCKLKEATNQIARADAPHSAIAKIRRDMDFNIMNPIRSHLMNNKNLRAYLDKRRRRLLELKTAQKVVDECTQKNVAKTERRYLQASSGLDLAKTMFHEVDKHVFEWLYILEEYRGDILDSTLQTLKYLQYEFFATSAHAISSVLPVRMEFRPMVEMTPEHLDVQVEIELQEAEENGDDEVCTDFSQKLLGKMTKDNKNKPGDGLDSSNSTPALPVDPLSLSSLLSHGFEEGPARRALRLHQNDTQAAMDWLIGGGSEEKEREESVRMPTTIKRIQKLKAMRRAKQEKLRREMEDDDDDDDDDEDDPADVAVQPAPPTLRASAPAPSSSNTGANASVDLLNFDAPTDFTRPVDTSSLPPMRTFDISRCEKGPLTSSGPRAQQDLAQPEVAPSAGSNGAQEQVAELMARAQMSPEEFLLAAQQVVQQRDAVHSTAPSTQAAGPASGPDPSGLDPFW